MDPLGHVTLLVSETARGEIVKPVAIRFKLGVEPGLRYVSSLVLNLDCDMFQAWY